MSNLPLWALRRVRQPLSLRGSTCGHPRHYTMKADDKSRSGRKGRSPANIISTLIPSRIKPRDFLDPSHKISVTVRFPVSPTPSPKSQGLRYGVELPFPDRTRGFLYYYFDPEGAPLEGSIRFRVTADNSPSSFASGQDLVARSGFPWQYLLAQVACQEEAYRDIAEQLVHENLVTPEQLSRCREVFARQRRIFPQYTLFRLDSPFLVNFSNRISLAIVGEKVHPLSIDHLFKIQDKKSFFPWTGAAVARFEPPIRPEHAGRRVLHLRFVKILKPVACTVDFATYNRRILRPEEGQLFTVSRHHRPPEPWAYDIDVRSASQAATALRALWDASRVS
ncbi:hypothetical protein FB451DRAFT_1282155 [Mycena latifolia]|nr:hypothetical protein FB451DRAFT_1282155 [Mycena latifolia]